MKTISMITKITLCLCCFTALLFVTEAEGQVNNLEKAKQLWEKVIAAKGGRENLYSIRNILISDKTFSPDDDAEFRKSKLIDFYVLPGKGWSWIDARPGFTLGVNQYNFDDKIVYEVTEGAAPFVVKPFHSTDPAKNDSLGAKIGQRYEYEQQRFQEKLVWYLMETKWLQPTITGVRTEVIRRQKTDIISVSLGKVTIDYYIDPQTFLPNKIKRAVWFDDIKKFDAEDEFFLEDYIEINGVKFPQVIRRGKKMDNKTSYQINISYDENLFDKPPSIEAGPEAWKPK